MTTRDQATEPIEERPDPPASEGEPSSAGSSFEDAAAAGGGADAVPDTPDGVGEDYT